MNRIDKRFAGITLGALIGLGFLVWRSSTPRNGMEVHTEEEAQVEADKANQRRPRTGPRKPPMLSPIPAEAPEGPIDPEDPPQEEAQREDAGVTRQAPRRGTTAVVPMRGTVVGPRVAVSVAQ